MKQEEFEKANICEIKNKIYLINPQDQSDLINESNKYLILPKSQSQSIVKRIIKEKKSNNDNSTIAQPKKKKKTQIMPLQIQCFFIHQNIFYLSGHIVMEIDPQENYFTQYSVRQLEKNDNYSTIYPINQNSLLNFDQLIYMLENSQSIECYNSSQTLRKYQNIFESQIKICSQIKQVFDESTLYELQQERNKFKKQFIQNWIEQNLNTDQYYTILSVSTNIYKNSSCVENVIFSQRLFSLLGVDSNQLEVQLFKSHLLFTMLPLSSRKIYFQSMMARYLDGFTDKTTIIKDLELNTIDSIQIFCDIESKFIHIPYPSHLLIPGFEQFNLLMDNISITLYTFSQNTLQNVLNQRLKYQELNLENIEYSILAEMFINKFYPKPIPTKEKQKCDENNQSKKIEIQQNKKRCSYRTVSQE